jgi:hypothetical protein
MPARATTGSDEELSVPALGTSPITGVPNVVSWGGLNKFNTGSRWVIGDQEADNLINFLPQQQAFQQVPGPGAAIATLAAPVVWSYADVLNGNLFIYCLCTNGGLYQVSTGGSITTVGTGFGTAANTVDIANWQGTNMLICDASQNKIFNWNGSVLATVFSAQPGNFVAVYSGRLWIANGLTLSWTNAGTFNSFAGDGGSFAITDSGCGNPIIGLLNAQGSLYVFGSNWIKTVANLIDVGNPLVLTFQQPTITSQVSIISKWSIVAMGPYIYFANNSGIWQLSGSTPVKVSTPLDGFFQNLAASSFSAAYGRVLGKECVFWNINWASDGNNNVFGMTTDGLWFRVIPVNGTSTGSVAWITGQVSSITTNSNPIVYMIDPGGIIYNLFGSSAATVTSIFNSKIWDFFSKLAVDWFTDLAIQYVITGASSLTITEVGDSGATQGPASPSGPVTITHNPSIGLWQNNFNVTGQWQNNSLVIGNWQGTVTFLFVLDQVGVPFQDRGFGVNLTFVGTAIVLHAIVMTYRKMEIIKG